MKCSRCQFENPAESLFCSRCGTQLIRPQRPSPLPETLTLQTQVKELAPGSVLAGRYQVIEELGKGGMGRVYKAFDTEIREHIALKLLSPEIATDEGVLERFRNELKLARKISHRNICRMYDLGRTGDTAYITMEFVPGEDLKSLLKRIGHLPVPRTVAVAQQVCEGLAEAHSQGIVHRDLKPQNIMIDRDGNARIMDFGIARSVKGKGITDTGVVIGTPDYMAPEQFEGMEADQTSDIYSLGTILYEMVTGEAPFEGETPLVVALKHKTEKPRDPRELNPQIPESLSRLVQRCLEKERQKRHQSVIEVLAELEKIEKGIPTTRTITMKEVPGVFPRRLRLRTILLPGLVLLVVAAVVIGIFLPQPFRDRGAPPVGRDGSWKSSIAVLPFEDLSPQKDQEHFCNGITEDLITKLATVGQLKVISRTSVMRYKETEKDIKDIGRELGVATLLEGSIQREKDNIRVNVQLIDTKDGSHLWAESFDRKVESIFTIQDEISRAIVNALRIELVAGQEYMLVKRYTQNPDAYNLYLEGRFQWNKRTEDGLRKSIALFEEAAAKDPNFALAYAGVADAHNMLAVYGHNAPADTFPRAKEAAEKALEMDDALAEGYISLAFVKYQYDWDWMGAEMDFNWAIGLNPSYATAYHWYGILLISQGRFEEALAKLEQARELDPRSLPINTDLAALFYYSHQYDQAIRQAKEVLKIDPDFHRAHAFLGASYGQKKSFRKAFQEFEKADEAYGRSGFYASDMAYIHALAGRREEAQRILGELEGLSRLGYLSPYSLGLVWAALGETDLAFEYFEQAYKEKDQALALAKVDPRLDPLREDPRFVGLLQKMGLD